MGIDHIDSADRVSFQLFALDEQWTRRQWIALGGLAVASACGRKKGSGYAGYALIATSGDETVAVVDLRAFQLLDPIAVGAPPSAVITNDARTHGYVLTPGNGSVHVVDANLEVVRSRKLADEISEIRLTSDGRRVIAVSRVAHELMEADATTLRVLRRHKLSGEPFSLDLSVADAAGPYAAVSTGDGGTVELFELRTGARRNMQMPGRIGAVRFRADGQRLLVADLENRGLTALTAPGLERIADLPLAMQPENLCFNSDAGQLFVSGEGMDGVAIVFPYNPLVVEQTVLAGRDPGVMACSQQPAFLFVGSNSGSDVCILNIDTRKVIGLVDVGQRPTYITTTPDSQYVLVLDDQAGTLAVIRIPAIRVDPAIVRSKSGASLFTMLQVGDRPVHAAVVSWNV